DQITYTITDNAGQATTSTLSIRINPAAVTDAYSTRAGSPITVDDVLVSGTRGVREAARGADAADRAVRRIGGGRQGDRRSHIVGEQAGS
ncbi:hypothetical protein ACC691_39135, partial [Rhizobium johnstonii]|uniref:hypothetical protein n=1 Tax=Rhizobium johnstonii TaxID=3019933 RepID=UPI003F96B675